MCGIAGFTGGKNFTLLNKQLHAIQHRGHDDRTTVYSNGVNFGMNRLAIVDLTKGLYPMRYKQWILLYNGEIYNYKEIQQKHLSNKIHFKTSCDAEVILPLYEKYGVRAFSILEGMFAICIVDTKAKKVILSRDKVGEKPLYFYHNKSQLVFGSEIKSVLIHPQVIKKVNTNSFHNYLYQGYSSTDSLISNVSKVLPSECLEFSLDTHTFHRMQYWKPSYTTSLARFDESVETLRALIEKSVNLRLVADVPVGCFLSGGLDSSIISYFAAKTKPNIHTYSVSFPSLEKYDESQYATAVSSWLGTQHKTIVCTPNDIQEILSNIGLYIDEPVSDPAFIPTLIMAREARKSVKVVLTGEGADELFAGYSRYPKQLLIETIKKSPFITNCFRIASFLTNHKHFNNISKTLSERYHTQQIWFPNEINTLCKNSTYSKQPSEYFLIKKLTTLNSMLQTDFRGYLAEQLLMKVDKATMAANLEARAPYLDSEIMDFAFKLPQQFKLNRFQNKYILRKVAEEYFPKSFVWRRKHGFSVPLQEWLKSDLREQVYDSVDYLSSFQTQINIKYYLEKVNNHMQGVEDNTDKIWSMLIFSNWINYHNILL